MICIITQLLFLNREIILKLCMPVFCLVACGEVNKSTRGKHSRLFRVINVGINTIDYVLKK